MISSQLRQINVKRTGNILQFVIPLQFHDELETFRASELTIQSTIPETVHPYMRSRHSSPLPQAEYLRLQIRQTQLLRTSTLLCIDELMPKIQETSLQELR